MKRYGVTVLRRMSRFNDYKLLKCWREEWFVTGGSYMITEFSDIPLRSISVAFGPNYFLLILPLWN